MLDLSVIIVNYNTLNLTRDCIESVKKHTYGIDYEIIIVDNASTDGSQEWLNSCDGVVFVESGANIGFGRANNMGFEYSSGRYIFLLNSDTIVENNILFNMVREFDLLPPDVSCVGTLLIHGDRLPSHSFGYFVDWKDEFRRHVKQRPTNIIQGKQQEVDYVSGADLFVRRDVAEKYGLFDPDFFMYYEDMEVGLRYRRNGFRSLVLNEKGIVHLEGASSNSTYRKTSAITRSYLMFLRKSLSQREFMIAKICILSRRLLTVWHYRWTLRDKFQYIFLMIKG